MECELKEAQVMAKEEKIKCNYIYLYPDPPE